VLTLTSNTLLDVPTLNYKHKIDDIILIRN